MGGPSASILLRGPIDAEVEGVVRASIRRVAESVEGDHFWIRGAPFVVRFAPEYPEVLAELADEEQIPLVLGWTPRGVVSLDALVGWGSVHQELGALCAALSDALDGLIDLGGAIAIGPDRSGSRWSPPVCVPLLEGVLYATSYRIEDDRYGTCHYCDAALMRGWLRDPRFRLVK